MNKKKIIIIAAPALISFAGSFVLGWLLNSGKSAQPNDQPQFTSEQVTGQSAGQQSVPSTTQPNLPARKTTSTYETSVQSLTEKQLKELVYEIQQKMKEYEEKLSGLEKRKHRLEMTQQSLKKDIQKLNDLRVEVASAVQRLENEREKLLNSRVEINKTEQANLKALASAYDRMDSGSASKIMASMCIQRQQKEGKKVIGGQNTNMPDAVKILYYMSDRTKAKLLAEMVQDEPQLAAVLTENLKRIEEN